MITLHQFGPAFGLRTASPFGLKLEAYMKLSSIPYKVEVFAGNPSAAPKGKIPFITAEDGRKFGDSALIIQHLIEKHGDKLDAHLTPEQRAIGHALRRMAEEGLYFPILYSRWVDDSGFAAVAPVFFAGMPGPVRAMVGMLVRRNTRKVLHGQGTGRHTREEVYALGRADLQALSDALGDKPFFLGDKPTSYDAALYGTLQNLIAVPTGTPLTTFAGSLPNLVAFCERVTKRCFEETSSAKA